MKCVVKNLNFLGKGHLITDSTQFNDERFYRDSHFLNKDQNFCVEPELPAELRFFLSRGYFAYLEFNENLEYDDFWREIIRCDFLAEHLDGLIEKLKDVSVTKITVLAKTTFFYQGYKNNEFSDGGERRLEKYFDSLDLELRKTGADFDLNISSKF